MNDNLIEAEALSKKYVIGHQAQRESYKALRDVIARRAKTFVRKASDLAHGRAVIEGDDLEEIWALRDVSFSVKRGEVLGIIGRNGAGKSTLLKILSRITEPTSGRVTLRGRVASLLEVGTGFHLELSGRENIFLNGAILGMSRAEIRSRFDEIVAFAEVERFLDTPVKRYSSGMYVRLAFAVAAHLEPEILIVDEVLAVGDIAFQKKCLGKMKDVSEKGGRTVLFVSHNLSTIRQLCGSAILMESGRLVLNDSVSAVVGRYSRETTTLDSVEVGDPSPELRDVGFVRRFVVETDSGGRPPIWPVGMKWRAKVDFVIARPMAEFTIALGITGNDGTPVQTAWSAPMSVEPGAYSAVFEQSSVVLAAGSYGLLVGLSENDKTFQQLRVAQMEISPEGAVGHFPVTSGVGVVLNSMAVRVARANET